MMHTLRVASLPGQIYTPGNSKQLRACIDSAASADMIPHKSYFESITYYDPSHEDTPTVLLGGDETTRIPVRGQGMAVYAIQGKIIKKEALYVPNLGSRNLPLQLPRRFVVKILNFEEQFVNRWKGRMQ